MSRIFLLFPVFLLSCLQEKVPAKIVYNLDFSITEIKDFKWTYSFKPYVYIDSTEEKINGKYPACFAQNPHEDTFLSSLNISPNLKIIIQQQLFIHQLFNIPDTVKVSIRNKSCNLSEAWLKLFCMDANDNLLYSDSIDINNDGCWVYKELSFPVMNVEKILLGIYALGYNYPSPKLREVQKLYLDRIGVTINNKSVEDLNDQPIIEKVPLNREQIICLVPTDVNSFEQIPIPSNKTIIGIGESIHGSLTINEIEVQIMKNLIKNHNCKLLLIEASIYPILLANLYIQGKFPENNTNILHEVALYTPFYSSSLFCDFMLWLKRYNETTTEKVHIYGTLDLNYHIYVNHLFDYLYAFYNKQTDGVIRPLLQMLYERKFAVLKDTIPSTQVAQILGKQNYSDFLYALTSVTQSLQTDSLSFNTRFHQTLMRDYQMFEIAEKYMSENIKIGEKTCIVAHMNHLGKKGYGFPYFHSMGYFLEGKHKDNYFVTSVFAGKGSITSISTKNDTLKMEPMNLNFPRDGSIESLCFKNNLTCFYYSTNNLHGSNFYYRNIGNAYIEQDEYGYGNLKSRIDGFIFSSESQAPNEPRLYINEFALALDKIQRHSNIMKNIKQ
jgi:erythromycin esterase-like protein